MDNKIPQLKSRKPFWSNYFQTSNENDKAIWQSEWNTCNIQNKDLITDPSNKVPGFDLPRKIWTVLNRIRTGLGCCKSMLFKWNSIESHSGECGEAEETIEHLINNCPIFKFQNGLRAIHEVTESFLNWVVNFKSI